MHILDANQFDRQFLNKIFDLTDNIRRYFEGDPFGKNPHFAIDRWNWDSSSKREFNYIVGNIFQEDSTRTRCSFSAAAMRLGGQNLNLDLRKSSAEKGESFSDTIRTFSQYVDVIVLRHSKVGAAKEAAEASDVPVINAGDGGCEHPTQALLDIYTMSRELKKVDGLKVMFLGDLDYARTISSLRTVLSLCYNVEIKEFSILKNIKSPECINMLGWADVIYMTRIQQERYAAPIMQLRHPNFNPLKYMKKNSILMHPGPRVNEVDKEVDLDIRNAYWRQAKNGMFVRMALLKTILGHLDKY